MSANRIIQAYARKALTKNQGSGITTIANQFVADSKAGEILTLLKNAGLPINQLDDYIRSESDLLKFLNLIKASSEPRVISATSAEGRAITDKLFGKKGEVVEFPQKRTFKEEIDAMKKSGDLVDEDNMVISEKITDRDMFKNSNLNKKDSVTDTITYIKSLEPMTAMKEANLVIGRKGRYKNLTPEESKKILTDTEDHIFERDIPIDPEDMAKGGRAGLYTGGMVDVEPNLSDIGHGSDALMARTRLVAPDSQATTSTGLNYLLAEDNDNIRVPFAGGGGGRRAFLKMMGLTGAGIAGLKSGMVGLGEGTTKKAITETVKQSAGSGGQVPPYFLNLVKKIKTLGDDTLATKDKAIAKKYKDYTMEEDFAGNIEIIKKGDDVAEDVFMSYKIDDVPVKGKKGSTKVEEYEEYTARPDREGKMKDIEQGVPDEVVQEGTVFEDTLSEFGKADGGRIGFSAGGGKFLLSKLGINSTSRRFLEKVFGKEKFATMIENDPEMHRGMLEVVEMFRKKDKEGLKMYMQKFLPHMDDATVEDFIIGSGGTEGIEGQLIRLGSGRDYKGKLDMIKEADQIRKLENFDIDGASKNAEGGRIGLFLGGGLTPGKSLLKNMLKFMAKDGSHKKSPAEVLKMMNPKQFQKLLNDPRYMGKVSSEAPEGLDKIIQDMVGKTKTERSDMVGDIISASRNIKKVDDDILKYKLTIIKDMVSKGIDREIAVEAAENLSKEVAKSAGKKSTPKITEQGLLELENIQKNLITKDRKLQSQGGLTTMLGE